MQYSTLVLVSVLPSSVLTSYFFLIERRNVLKPFNSLMAGGMLRDNYRVSTVLCKNGGVPFVVSELFTSLS